MTVIASETSFFQGPEGRVLVARERAELPCGCCAWTGYAGKEPFIGFQACSDEHTSLVNRAKALYAETLALYEAGLASPHFGRPAVEVADDMLAEAERSDG